ncbi:30S ribosomal protein S4 [Moorella sp. Hama-1]|uniref:30S ribosomal protein S4 n=1 Tax=Moorella sp. Hama-1 TaxID=2138101 RepID=UPI000D65ECB4|nr:30S ribosomal protein S4 [Moorella sp. Hama-1]MDN5362643.1 small subunit ribosomal protein [Moorella sp. (in: firmicutes)]BCV23118.1 30S ribosomal protein S4 [Moorella sp. Hama-1]
MARYTDSTCRLCRREGAKLFLKGDRCYSDKCAVARRSYAPGQHGQGRKKVSEYGLQLREKQKVRRIYGVMERQFRNYFEKAERQKGVTGENLLVTLERRLDNIVYRLGFADSRAEARTLIRHGHFLVNGRKVNIPSYLVRAGDTIKVREKSKASPRFKEIAEAAAHRTVPAWLSADGNALEGHVLALPTREQIDTPVQEHLIVELYSR